MMSETHEIYKEILQDLLMKSDDFDYTSLGQYSDASRQTTFSNGNWVIYSVAIKNRMRAFAIPIEETYDGKRFPQWKGVAIEIVTIPEYTRNHQRYIELRQMPGTEAYIFEIVVEDLRRGIKRAHPSSDIIDITQKILKKWKDFFSEGKKPVLAEKETQGLYGELMFLNELIQKIGLNSVNFWFGKRHTHDFYIGQNAVEVKTSVSQAPYYAHINSEYQLDTNDVTADLYLKMYIFRKDSIGGQRLSELIKNIRRQLKCDEFALDTFNNKLEENGYFDVAEDYYQIGYTIRDSFSFKVEKGFPRLIKENLPKGIYHIEYDISVSECMDYAIDANELLKKIEV